MNKATVIIIVLALITLAEATSCTIIMVSDSKVTLAGSNEDSAFPLTIVWFVPPTEGNYGRVCLGYKMMFNSLQGGMNEKGLFLDGNALGRQGWQSDERKKVMYGSLLDKLLATCATVEDVKEFFNSYNTPALDQARIPVMDKSGASMIVEWYNGEVVFLESDESYQIATNFVGSEYKGVEKPCWRYNKAVELLKGRETFSTDIVREVLDATHQQSRFSSTVYSFICDLEKGTICIYNYFDFSNPVEFNLREELDKGFREYYLSHLFSARNEGYRQFISEGPVRMVEFGYNRINRNTALMFFNILKFQYPKAFNKAIDIELLSQVGNNLMLDGKLDDAVVFLERNRDEFPDSARVHFELAGIYMKTGNSEGALNELEMTLSIKPDHIRAKRALDSLVNK